MIHSKIKLILTQRPTIQCIWHTANGIPVMVFKLRMQRKEMKDAAIMKWIKKKRRAAAMLREIQVRWMTSFSTSLTHLPPDGSQNTKNFRLKAFFLFCTQEKFYSSPKLLPQITAWHAAELGWGSIGAVLRHCYIFWDVWTTVPLGRRYATHQWSLTLPETSERDDLINYTWLFSSHIRLEIFALFNNSITVTAFYGQ